MSIPKRGGGIDLSALNVSKTPRSAREVAEKKMRAELRGDTGSKKTGAERDEELAEFYRKKNAEKTEVARVAKQKLLLANPTQSLIDCACGGPTRSDDLAFLISKDVDLDDMVDDSSALMAACRWGCQAGLEALVRAGAEVDLANSVGQTALMVAVNAGHIGAVSFLLDHSGARPDLLDASGHSALQCAFERGASAIASKIVRALSNPPPKVTTVAREKLAEAKAKALAIRRKEAEDKQAAMDRKIKAAMMED